MQKLHTTFRKDDIYCEAKAIVEQLQQSGHSCFFVGGAIRDHLAGLRPKDIDLVTTATPDELKVVFPEAILVGASFGVSLIGKYEIVTAREERNYLDGRRPEEVKYTTDLAIDVMRRDFTINALLYDPIKKEVIDYVGGLQDLQAGIIRTVGNAYERFNEDYLRMLRAVRFAAALNFKLSSDCAQAIKDLAPKTALLAAEKVRDELTTMLTRRFPEMRPSTRRRLLGSPTFATEFELNRLDCISCHGLLDSWLMILDEIIELKGELAMPDPLVQGRDLINAGHKPSPIFGKILKETYEYQLREELTDQETVLSFALDLMKKH